MKYGLDLVRNTSRSVLSAAREQVRREGTVTKMNMTELDDLAGTLKAESRADEVNLAIGILTRDKAVLREWNRGRMWHAIDVRLIMLEHASLQTGELDGPEPDAPGPLNPADAAPEARP